MWLCVWAPHNGISALMREQTLECSLLIPDASIQKLRKNLVRTQRDGAGGVVQDPLIKVRAPRNTSSCCLTDLRLYPAKKFHFCCWSHLLQQPKIDQARKIYICSVSLQILNIGIFQIIIFYLLSPSMKTIWKKLKLSSFDILKSDLENIHINIIVRLLFYHYVIK